MLLASRADGIERSKFATLHRVVKAMETATLEAASYAKFSRLAQALAAELLSAKDRIETQQDRDLVLLCAKAGLAYGDSLTLWRVKIERGSTVVPAESSELVPLIARYAIAVERSTVDADRAIHLVWAVAGKSVHKADLLYEGRDAEFTATVEAEDRREMEHQRALSEQVSEEFERAEREAARPKPFEASPGNWTCPRGYVIRRGRCLDWDEVAHLPKIEMGR